jgi:hypothetical protein
MTSPFPTLLMTPCNSEERAVDVRDFRAHMLHSMIMRMAGGIANAIGEDLVDAKVKQQIRQAALPPETVHEREL